MNNDLDPFSGKGFSLFGVTINFPQAPPRAFWYGLLPVLLFVGLFWVSAELRIGFAESIFGKKAPITDVARTEPVEKKQVPPKQPVSEPESVKEAVPVPVPEVKQGADASVHTQVMTSYFEVSQSLRYGAHYSGPESTLRALDVARISVPQDIEKMFIERLSKRIPKSASVAIVRITAAELGFSREATFPEIVESAKQKGLQPFPFDAVAGAALTFSGDKRLFFATQIAPEGLEWHAVLSVAKPRANAPVEFQLVEWHDWVTRTFSRERTFHPSVTFLFAL